MSPEVRIGDEERERAVTALGEHYAAGRLTKEEYDDRAAAAWVARTESGLRPLFVDLPAPHGLVSAQQPPRRAAAAPQRPGQRANQRRGAGVWPVVPVLPVLVGLLLLALLTDFPWFPFWVVLGVLWLVRSGCGGHRRG